MATLSPVRAAWPLVPGLKLLHRGKVRDTYDLGDRLLLVVTTDAISIFDFVLNAIVPDKGKILCAMSHFWFRMLEEQGISTHMVAAGRGIDAFLPKRLQGNRELQSRAMVAQRLDMFPVEFIGRAYLTGSVLAGYQETGKVYGTVLPPGLRDGDKLPHVLFTPTDKAEEGHDEPIDPGEARTTYPIGTTMFLDAFDLIADYAGKRGIIVADAKGELGRDRSGRNRLGDEFGTPDSSRFWLQGEWILSREKKDRHAPRPLDKQLARE